MSHEIRTPATAIVGYIDIMQRRPDRSPEQAASWFDRIRNNAEHLVMLVNDLLDLSKIESGQVNVFVEPSDLFNILRQVDATMGHLAEQKGVRFEIAHDSALPRQIRTDPLRLKQILINLINNAIKFTEADGTVSLEIGYEDAGARGRLRCAVTDTGVGIPPEQLSVIFEPFMQAHADGKRQYGGVGLGLNISRRLAHLLGGDIRVNSRPGVGSTFTLEIDVGPADAIELIDIEEAVATVNDETAPASDGGLDLSDVRVLIAEDNPDNQKIITLLLEDTGARIDLAPNGVQAVERFFEAARQDDPYDLVLMDMQMPEMDGYAATRELRARGVETPVIAMTAYALDEDRDRCLGAGCDTHVAKPIAPESMYEAVLRLVPKARRRQDEPTTPRDGTAQDGTRVMSSLAGVPGFEALLNEYVEAAAGMTQELRDLWERGEVEPARQLIHKIRGSAGSYGFGPVSKAAAACEIRILAGDDPAEVAPQVEQLLHLLERIAAPRSSRS